MSYNKNYNTRFSGRFNTPGQFVPAAECVSGAPQPIGSGKQRREPMPITKTYSAFGQNQTPAAAPTPAPGPVRKQPQHQNLQPAPVAQPKQAAAASTANVGDEDVKMTDAEVAGINSSEDDNMTVRPHWMKSKLPGVKKLSNRERRRRQNENLRRLLTPKNALMVLNEMMPNEQQFKVEPAAANQYYKTPNTHNFCADLTIDGTNYKGYGDNKLMARNAAAEQAIRDLIIKKMHKVINSDTSPGAGEAGCYNGEALPDEEVLPMIQLASFALHKLFTEWEYEGHKVPQLKPSLSTESVSEPGARKVKELPANAAQMHPCMLLTYMRPHLEYRELAVEGDRPQNMLFTMGVDVDNATYVGKACNKKEARKQAAAAACQALFGVTHAPASAPPAAPPPAAH